MGKKLGSVQGLTSAPHGGLQMKGTDSREEERDDKEGGNRGQAGVDSCRVVYKNVPVKARID